MGVYNLAIWVPAVRHSFAGSLVQIVRDFGLYTKRVCTNVAFGPFMVHGGWNAEP